MSSRKRRVAAVAPETEAAQIDAPISSDYELEVREESDDDEDHSRKRSKKSKVVASARPAVSQSSAAMENDENVNFIPFL